MMTQDQITKIVKYDQETGEFFRLVSRHKHHIGKMKGTVVKHGYIRFRIAGKFYLAHRLAHLIVNGHIPEYIDHINHNTSDNRWENLRGCTVAQNMANARIRSDNKTGFKGVHFDKQRKKFSARIQYNQKKIQIGYFHTREEAALAYLEKAKELFAEFAFDGSRSPKGEE